MTQLLVSFDLDDAWAYLRARGEPGWELVPSIIELASQRLIDVLDAGGIAEATVFVVGEDARRPAGVDAIRRFQARGLEIADHSDWHRGELATLGVEAIRQDLDASADALAQVTGERPVGFRCPSFGASPNLSTALSDAGYAYDASALPTPLMPLLRLYHLATAGRGQHAPSYGNLKTVVAPLRPTVRHGMLSVPTTTVPVLRTPFHGSYLSALAGRSLGLARAYARFADRACRLADLPISFLLHPTDVLDGQDAPQLAYFPGMSTPWASKRDLLVDVLRRFRDGRRPTPLGGLLASQPGGR